MYVNAFLLGVLSTLFVEMALVITLVIIASIYKDRNKK